MDLGGDADHQCRAKNGDDARSARPSSITLRLQGWERDRGERGRMVVPSSFCVDLLLGVTMGRVWAQERLHIDIEMHFVYAYAADLAEVYNWRWRAKYSTPVHNFAPSGLELLRVLTYDVLWLFPYFGCQFVYFSFPDNQADDRDRQLLAVRSEGCVITTIIPSTQF